MEKKRKRMKISLAGLFSLCMLVLFNTAAVKQIIPEVPYVPTPEKVVAEMLKMADVGKNDVLYDLGCGDGRIVIAAAKEMGCRGVGIDIDPERIDESRENAKTAGVEDRVEFLLMDLFEADISEASVVTLYLLSRVNIRLRPILLRDLKPGTRVVSHDFDMDEWTPDQSAVIDVNSSVQDTFPVDDYWDQHDVYLWIIPANVTGIWKWTMPAVFGGKSYTLEIDQTFQEVEGKALEGITPVPLEIKDGKIAGSRLEFTIVGQRDGRTARMHFQGKASGHTLEGNVSIEGKPNVKGKWQAQRLPSSYKPIEK